MTRVKCWYVGRSIAVSLGSALALCVAMATLPALAWGQAATATLSGTILDETGAVIPDVQITLVNLGTGLQRSTTADSQGRFIIPLLPPGRYSITAQRGGFTPAEVKELVLNVGDEVAIKLQLKVAAIGESVTVVAEPSRVNTSPAVSTVVDREFVQNLPLNGRSFQSLLALTPGLVFTKASGELGQFSVNGQRSNANYFMVDGVAANIGVRQSSLLQTASGSVPGLTAAGGTNNLVSVDALEEFKIQTSSYAPEFGRSPGAQISLVTRSGTNTLHGSVADYFRNDALDATDWFVKRDHLAKPALRQQQFAAVVGGPVWKDRTFYFFSYEGLRLRVPQAKTTDVPTLATRQNAILAMRPFLNAFPQPTGPDGPNGVAPFTASFSDPSTLDATSIRIDHKIGTPLTVFARYNYAPSNLSQRTGPGSFSINTIVPTDNLTQTLTGGSTWVVSPAIVNDLRVNWSRSVGAQAGWQIDDFGGATPLLDGLPFPPGVSASDGFFSLQLVGGTNLGYAMGKNTRNVMLQTNILDTVSVAHGQHQLKAGFDYRALAPSFGGARYTQGVVFGSAAAAMSGTPLVMAVAASDPGSLSVRNLSLFAQDTWRAGRRATLTYGLRWELNPPPQGRDGRKLQTIQGLDDPRTLTLAPAGTPLYRTRYTNFAPRAGIAYRLTDRPGGETIVRGGGGVFYDLGTGSIGNALSQYPFAASRIFVAPFPLDAARAATPPIVLAPPHGSMTVFDPNLTMPRTYQWNVAIEQSFAHHDRVSVSYIGAAGRRLLRQESFTAGPSLNPDFTTLFVTRNGSFSDYRALQVQYEHRLSRGFQALASYTLADSTDTISNDRSQTNISVRFIDPRLDLGPSDFDVRHSMTAAVTYQIPAVGHAGVIEAISRNWSVDTIVRARSATPIDVALFRNIGFGSSAFRPDIVPGVPLYVDDPAAPRGQRINRAAFVIPPEARQGTLGRNALRGFAMSQVDAALRRRFSLRGRARLEVAGELFNLFNTPNFGDPSGFLTSSVFGVATQMLGRSLGLGGVNGGFSPLYQVGGPRSVQLSVRASF